MSTILPGHTPGHINCPVCEASRLRHAAPHQFSSLLFSDASHLWLSEHRDGISEKTYRDYEYYLRSLTKFFGELQLSAIHIGHIEQYQEWRQTPRTDENGREWKAGPSAINHELNTLAQILERAELWEELRKVYKPLKQPKSRAGKALKDADQERHLFDVAASNPRWKVAYWASLVTANTSAGPNEIRHLRLRDLSLKSNPPYITITEGLKNEFRERTLPLNPSALWAMKQLFRRASRLGAANPDDYLLPGRAKSRGAGWDFTRPMGSWKKAWQSLRVAAGMPTLRMYDLRHHALTKIYERPDVAEQVATEIAGHEDTKMRKHYSHIRLEAKRKALEAIEVKPGPAQIQLPFPSMEVTVEKTVENPAEKLPPSNVLEWQHKSLGRTAERP